MTKDYSLYVQHALDAIDLINQVVTELDFEDLKGDPVLTSSVMYQLIVVGEVVSKLPEHLLDNYPEIPWRQIKAARNRIVHDYYSVDIEILWAIIQQDLPKLEETLELMNSELRAAA